MGFFDRFKPKPKEATAPVATAITGQPLQVIITRGGAVTPHPDYYDRERNAARIAQLTEAISHFEETGAHETHAERYAELKGELDKQLKIRALFYGGEEN